MSDTNGTFGDVTFTASDTEDDTYGLHEGSYMYGNTNTYTTTTTTAPTTYNIGSNTSTSTITLTPPKRDINLDVEGDIIIDGKSLKEFMETVSNRLSILTPNPELLEKYDALKEAYEHYKILEKICTDDTTTQKT